MSQFLLQRYLTNRIGAELVNYGAELAEVKEVKNDGLVIDCLPLVKTKDTQAIKGVLVAQSKYLQMPLSSGDFVLLLKTAYTIGDFATSGKVKSHKSAINYIALPLSTKSDIDKASETIFIGNQIASLKDIFTELINALKTSFANPAANGKPLDPAFNASIETLSQKIDKVFK